PTVTARITIASDAAATITSSTLVTFTAVASGGGSTPRYQWLKNGLSAGTNSATYQNSNWVNKDSVQCILTSSEACITGSPAKSNTLILAVSNGPYCPSNGVTTKEYIDKFILSDLNNASGNNNGYGDFSPVVVNLMKTKSYSVTLVPAWIGTARSEAYAVWIDLNKDGDFLDSGEMVFSTAKTTATSVTGTFTLPSGATVGLTKMRVSMKYNILPTSCEVNFPGEVEDYGVFIQDPVVDNLPPTAPVNLTAANLTATSADLSWTAATDNFGVTGYEVYQNGVLVTTVTTPSAKVTGLLANTTYNFTVKAKDAAGNLSVASNTVTITTPAITYCLSNGTTTLREYIDRFQLGSINNTSGFNSGYGNFTQLSTNLVLGSTNAFTLIPKWNGTVRAEAYRIWIDLNADGDFADAGEQVANSNKTTATSITGSIVIPVTATKGATRLRVTMKYNASPGPCDVNISGEVEDYTVIIQ
ncbi:MAG: GEVED domain-containing protein, partial [Chitinophagaceae bacterium]